MRPSVRPTTAWTTSETTTRATCTSLEHGRRARTFVHLFILSHTSWLKIWVLSFHLHSHPWSHLLESLLLFNFHLSHPCLLLFLPPPALRAVLWARQPDRHGKPVLLRQGEWRRLRRLRLPHRLWAQLHGLQRAQRLFRFLFLHYPVIGPGHGWHGTRQAAHRGTPRTSRLVRTRRRVSQSVSQSSSSVVFDRAGKPAGERTVDQSVGFGVTRNTYSAHSKFSENTPSWESGR